MCKKDLHWNVLESPLIWILFILNKVIACISDKFCYDFTMFCRKTSGELIMKFLLHSLCIKNSSFIPFLHQHKVSKLGKNVLQLPSFNTSIPILFCEEETYQLYCWKYVQKVLLSQEKAQNFSRHVFNLYPN